MYLSRAGLRVGPARQLPGASACKGHQDVTGIFGNMISKLRFLRVKACLQNLSAIVGTYPQIVFAIPVLGQSSLTSIPVKGWNKGHNVLEDGSASDFKWDGKWKSVLGCICEKQFQPQNWDENALHTHYRRFPFLPVLPEGGGRSSLGGIVGILAWDDGQCPEFQSWLGLPVLPLCESKHWWQEHEICCLKKSSRFNWVWRMDGICGKLTLKLALVINI
jgi:hypothetical protein